MKINLNENAERYFNDKVIGFLYQLKPDKTPSRKSQRVESSQAHTYVSGHFGEKEIIKFTSMGYVDNLTGKQVARFFEADKKLIGLDQNAHAEFVRFIESLYQKREINSVLSLSFLYDCVFKWFEDKYKGKLPAENDLISFLKENAEEAIKKFTVYMPISFLSIQKPFEVGNIRFEYLTTNFCDKYISNAKSKISEQGKFDENSFNVFETRFRNRYQGNVFAAINIEAEQERCIEIAKLAVRKALTVLRFFSPSAFLPEIPSYFCIMGESDLPKNYYFVFENGEEIPSVHEGIDERRMHKWSISASEFAEISKLGIGLAAGLIFKDNPNEFEDSVLNSMHLFGRALTSKEFQDKIVYALVSAENLLLQNQSEPIQSNVGLRLAFLTESEHQKRKAVKVTINKSYKFRSAYIHHGKVIEEWELLKDLQHAIWTAIRNAMILANKFATRKDFFDYIEKMILS